MGPISLTSRQHPMRTVRREENLPPRLVSWTVLLNNTAMVDSGTPTSVGTVSINSQSASPLNNLPNYLCPLNIRFTHSEAVAVQNVKLRIFDRNNINNHASGVTTYVYEARHPSVNASELNLSHRGRLENSWYQFDPASGPMTDMIFTSSPGMSGVNTVPQDGPSLGGLVYDGTQHRSLRHDWYVALSSEPDTVGSKTQYGLYFTLEYL